MRFPGALQMGVEREKKLSAGQVPQLETRVKRGANHVCHVENRQDGKIHERSGGKGLPILKEYRTKSHMAAVECVI